MFDLSEKVTLTEFLAETPYVLSLCASSPCYDGSCMVPAGSGERPCRPKPSTLAFLRSLWAVFSSRLERESAAPTVHAALTTDPDPDFFDDSESRSASSSSSWTTLRALRLDDDQVSILDLESEGCSSSSSFEHRDSAQALSTDEYMPYARLSTCATCGLSPIHTPQTALDSTSAVEPGANADTDARLAGYDHGERVNLDVDVDRAERLQLSGENAPLPGQTCKPQWVLRRKGLTAWPVL